MPKEMIIMMILSITITNCEIKCCNCVSMPLKPDAKSNARLVEGLESKQSHPQLVSEKMIIMKMAIILVILAMIMMILMLMTINLSLNNSLIMMLIIMIFMNLTLNMSKPLSAQLIVDCRINSSKH